MGVRGKCLICLTLNPATDLEFFMRQRFGWIFTFSA